MRRKSLTRHGAKLVEREGYASVRAGDLRSFFDVIAEKRSSLYIIKFMENIDALAPMEAAALRNLGAFLEGTALVVGDRCTAGSLRDGTAFMRHGIACISGGSLEGTLHGLTAKRAMRFFSERSAINGQELQRLRKLYGLSMRELAEQACVSKDSIFRYESLREGITPTNLKKLENFFESRLGRAPSARESGSARYGAFMNTGMKAVKLDMDPFTSAIKGRERYEAGREANYRTMKKWATLYKALNEVLGDYPFFVTKQKGHRRAIDGVPIIPKEELESAHEEEGLLNLIYENAKY